MLYTLTMQYVNYISIKLEAEKKKISSVSRRNVSGKVKNLILSGR